MHKIINHEDIVKTSLPFTKIYGGNGVHARDLIERELLVPGTEWSEAHFMTLPISITEAAAVEMMNNGIPQDNMASLAAVMTKTPNGVNTIHYLFGKGAKAREGKSLKVVFANTTPHSPLIIALMERAQSKHLKIIETSRIEHDKKMAYTQWLMHLWLVLAGRNTVQNADIKTSLLIPWQTPAQTVIDMIHANPFAEESIRRFFDELPRTHYNLSHALRIVLDMYLNPGDLDDFWTPNSDRIVDFVDQWNKITTSQEEIEKVRSALNTRWYEFLRQQIESIRPKKTS